MPDFYIVSDAPLITAETPDEAARQHAQTVGITAGSVLVATAAKSFDITVTPGEIDVQATP